MIVVYYYLFTISFLSWVSPHVVTLQVRRKRISQARISHDAPTKNGGDTNEIENWPEFVSSVYNDTPLN
jgi:hypothetical protein